MLIRWPEGSEAAAAALARPSSGEAEEVFPGSAAPSTHSQPGALTAGLLGSARAEQHRALLDTSMDRDPCMAPGYRTCSQSSSSPQCLLQVQAPQAQGSLMTDPAQWLVFAVTHLGSPAAGTQVLRPHSLGSCWHNGHTGPQSHSHGMSVLTLASPAAAALWHSWLQLLALGHSLPHNAHWTESPSPGKGHNVLQQEDTADITN